VTACTQSFVRISPINNTRMHQNPFLPHDVQLCHLSWHSWSICVGGSILPLQA
jgi:hypothetical protein